MYTKPLKILITLIMGRAIGIRATEGTLGGAQTEETEGLTRNQVGGGGGALDLRGALKNRRGGAFDIPHVLLWFRLRWPGLFKPDGGLLGKVQ